MKADKFGGKLVSLDERQLENKVVSQGEALLRQQGGEVSYDNYRQIHQGLVKTLPNQELVMGR